MAITKPTTTEDIKASTEPETPTGYTKVKAPSGAVTEVPDGILEALLDSGYTKSK